MNAAIACTSSLSRRKVGILVPGRQWFGFSIHTGNHSLCIFTRTSLRLGPTFLISRIKLLERISSCSIFASSPLARTFKSSAVA